MVKLDLCKEMVRQPITCTCKVGTNLNQCLHLKEADLGWTSLTEDQCRKMFATLSVARKRGNILILGLEWSDLSQVEPGQLAASVVMLEKVNLITPHLTAAQYQQVGREILGTRSAEGRRLREMDLAWWAREPLGEQMLEEIEGEIRLNIG